MDVTSILNHLGIARPSQPDLAALHTLIAAYTRRVPWETASRIAKRARTTDTADCPRFPDEFWSDAAQYGTGGTCFESNYAFFTLLQALGFEGYLTVNDMGETCGCHTAIVLNLAGEQWIADVGIPLYAPVPIGGSTETPYHTYAAQPVGGNRYEITRDRHPRPYIFTLINTPVSEADYRAATTNDYGDNGLFLDRVIITRLVDDVIWRFAPIEGEYLLESFPNGERTIHPLRGNTAEILASVFDMSAEVIRAALARVA